MNAYAPILMQSPLFAGIGWPEAEPMLQCVAARTARYEKNETLLHVGDEVSYVGMVLTGSLLILKEDFWGNRNILARIAPGELFAENYACIPGTPLGVSVTAAEAVTVLQMDFKKLLTTCSSSCAFHTRLIRNLLSAMALRGLALNDKLSCISQRSTREKLLTYLSGESQRQNSPSFTIPFNRQQLADYLSVDRSAMSSELCRLRREGVLDFERSRFTLLHQPE